MSSKSWPAILKATVGLGALFRAMTTRAGQLPAVKGIGAVMTPQAISGAAAAQASAIVRAIPGPRFAIAIPGEDTGDFTRSAVLSASLACG